MGDIRNRITTSRLASKLVPRRLRALVKIPDDGFLEALRQIYRTDLLTHVGSFYRRGRAGEVFIVAPMAEIYWARRDAAHPLAQVKIETAARLAWDAFLAELAAATTH